MKKILFLLLLTVSSYGQSLNSPDFVNKYIISGKIELNGHEPKAIFIFEATLEGIKIYDRDSKQKYKLRRCGEKECKIIHLEEDNFGKLNPYLINNTPFIQLAN